MAEKYVKVPIFPATKYLSPNERKEMSAPMKPESFLFDSDKVTVDEVLDCDRGISRKVGGRGFRFVCRVSWMSNGKLRTKVSVIWFDDFLQEWFVEVPESRVPVDWDAATQILEIDEHYGEE